MDQYIYQFVSASGSEYLTFDEAVRKYKQDGVVTSKSVREELQGQPTFSGWLGAMYNGTKDGKTVIRYETQEAYNMYSS
ncbi:MAG: hypothetical protein ACI33M_06460 [Lysinibacillus sp.]